MNAKGPNPYLKTRVLTAGPEELRLLLYEGAVRFARQAREALAAKNHEASYLNLSKAQSIVLELSNSLKHDVAPELCTKLSSLYTYIYRRLVDASLQRDLRAADEAIELLQFETDTWRMLMQKLSQSSPAPQPSPAAPAAGPSKAHAGLSLNG